MIYPGFSIIKSTPSFFEERIAADVLATLDGFEQKRRAFAAQFLVGRHGRFHVGQQLAIDRDEITAVRQAAKLVLRRIIHVSLFGNNASNGLQSPNQNP